MAKKADIRDVALAAKVSTATVSRVFNNIETVDPKLRKRVLDAAKTLHYVRNRHASALVSGRSQLFGVMISDITNPFFPEVIRGAEVRAVELGYEVIIGSTNNDAATMERCVQRMLERDVDGVAVMTFGIDAPLLNRFGAKNIPSVFIDASLTKGPSAAIEIDYEHGIHEAVQHLAVLGHRRLAFIAGPHEFHSAKQRELAFRNTVKSIGLKLPATYVVEGDHTIESGEKGFAKLSGLRQPPTAIMCSNDMTAIGVMHAAFEAGLQIPRDLSVIGFDDIQLARHVLPPLTTVRMSGLELGMRACDLLHALVEERKPPATDKLRTALRVRKSTSIPKDALQDLSPAKKS